MDKEYQQIVENDKQLKNLLVDQDIGVMSNFRLGNYDDEGLKEAIESAYKDSFNVIFKRYINTDKEGKITALLRTVDVLATKKSRDQIIEQLLGLLDEAIDHLNKSKELITKGGREIEKSFFGIDRGLSFVIIAILNQFDDYKTVADRKNKILINGIAICDLVAKAKPKKETNKYVVYNVLVNNIEKIRNKGEHEQSFSFHKKKINVKRNVIEVKYVLFTILIVLLMLIRMASRLNL